MVMHARKPQRISDGYFEKHQAHPYQKYSSSKRANNEYVASDNRYSPIRSPNGNVASHGHGGHSSHAHHHYSNVAEERGYASSRNLYIQKGCEKERDRDYKSSRDDVRSPKDKRSKDIERINHERERSNHERSESDKKSRSSGLNASSSRSSKYDKRSAPPPAGAPSASEWSEHISSSGKKYYYNSVSEVSQWEKPREWDARRTASKDSTYTSRSNHDKRCNSRSGRESDKSSKRMSSGADRYWNSGNRDDEPHDRVRAKHSTHEDGQSLQDMDISPDRSTPLSDKSYGVREANAARTNSNNNNNKTETISVPPVVVLDNSNQHTGSLLAAALPRIVSAPPCGGAEAAGAGSGAGGGGSGEAGAAAGSGTPQRDAGPPTPTHSENTDPHAPPLHLDNALPRKMEGLGSYSSVVGGALHQAPPMLTPSLVNYVRADLTAHVLGWPADILEKQSGKFTEDAYQMGCLQCTRVSAELKCARSLVRHTEIQATLQEQKIMYLRAQIAWLEELKSQNSFMSEP